ncbi:MAG: hypothetical protein NTW74_20825 [Acidobacteria bacterium]|nr:hypothetical protein [Acidobacteriota bacterium]
MNEEQMIADEPSIVDAQEASLPRRKTMSEAALAANRATAKKCTGPKTREGKFKSSLDAAWRRKRIAELIQLRLNNAIDSVIANSEPTPAAEITQPSFARQQAHEFRLANLFQRTLCRLQSINDKKRRNETKFIRDRLSFAA